MSFLSTFSALSVNGFQNATGANIPVANATIIYPPNAFSGQFFGSDLELTKSGNALVVGTEQGNIAYVYANIANTWTLDSSLTANANISYGVALYFGSTVSINEYGNIVAIGAPGADVGVRTGAGAVFVYEKISNAWSQKAKIELANNNTNDFFGFSVSLNNEGNILLVSAPGKSHIPNYDGSVFLFTSSNTSTWTQYNELINPDTANTGNLFGQYVDLAGNANLSNTSTIVYTVSNPATGPFSSKAYICRNNSIEYTYASLSIDGTGQPESVAINESGNTAIFGLPYTPNIIGQRYGEIQVYKYANASWSLNQTLTDPSRLIDASFLGYRSDISNNGNTIIGRGIGTIFGGSGGNYTASFTFANSTYSQSTTFVPPIGNTYYRNISIDGNGNIFASGSTVTSGPSQLLGQVLIINI
jgi:hypothetical protein